MLQIRRFRIASVARNALLFLAGCTLIDAANAFNCGPHFSTYEIRDGTHTGVRCVSFAPVPSAVSAKQYGFTWYGEGRITQ